jgi:pimeloyl-ACP methyl ester carboxylesterase
MPLSAPQVLIQGTDDDQIPPELPAQWARSARRIGSQAMVEMIQGADHFDLVDPATPAWTKILAHIKSLLAPTA